jgi:hypothetical protein
MLKHQVYAVVLLFGGGGCSVDMARQGRSEPDLTAVKPGANREQVVGTLGEPSVAYQGAQGGTDIFRIPLALPGSPERALTWAALDVMTLGPWEIVGSAVERNQGESLQFAVGYDPHGTVVHVSSSRF